jgi:hypothetical protein
MIKDLKAKVKEMFGIPYIRATQEQIEAAARTLATTTNQQQKEG